MFTRERLTRWTTALRKFPEKQGKGALSSSPDKFCCLGMLCEVEGVKKEENLGGAATYQFPWTAKNLCKESSGLLEGDLSFEFGDRSGYFLLLNMPALSYQEKKYENLVEANDREVPWSVIASHLDTFYPCSDESR